MMSRRQLIQAMLAGGVLAGCSKRTPAPAPVSLGPVEAAAAKLPYFDPPAMQNDFGTDHQAYQRFVASWSKEVDNWTEQAIVGDPWSVDFDHDRSAYFNPLKVGIPQDAPVAPIYWRAYPNRPQVLFGQNPDRSKRLSRQQIYQLVDTGAVTINGKTVKISEVRIPSKLCPHIDWSGEQVVYYPPGPRGWQDEYCEWSVQRNAAGKIVRVMFTCENSDYWFALWRQDPRLVHHLYQRHVSPKVALEDLYLRHQGNVVIDPISGCPAYDAVNKWNHGPQLLPDRGGAMHLTSAPNSLPAEIYIAAASTLPRASERSVRAESLICCSQYGQPHRGSDPHIGLVGNELSRKGFRITLTNPVGLYIRDPHFDGYELPANAPAQSPQPSEFWRVERGHSGGYTLHAVFEVPEELPFVVGDLTIYGEPIRWAGQIAETFRVNLFAAAIPAKSTESPLACVQDKSAAAVQPWPRQMLPLANFRAASPIRLTSRMAQGTELRDMVLVVNGGKPGAKIEFSGTGITATVTRFIPEVGHILPGDDRPLPAQAYVFDLSISATAEPGERGVRAINPGTQPLTLAYTPGFLEVLAMDSKSDHCHV